MSNRSDDTGQMPEVSGSGETGPAPETPSGDDTSPPPIGDNDATRTGATAMTEATRPLPESGPATAPGTATAAPDAEAAPSATEDAANSTALTDPDKTPTPIAPPAASDTEDAANPAAARASDGTPTQVAPVVAAAPSGVTAPPERAREGAAAARTVSAVPDALAGTDHTVLIGRPHGTAFLSARGLAAKGRQGPIFTDITLTAHLGQLVAVCGDGGDGRSSLLLALTGRFAHHNGTLEVDGQTKPGQIRRRFTIAQAGPPIRFEPYTTVGACIKETTTVSKGAATRANINAWLDRLALGVDTGDTIGFLPRIDQIRFAIACAAACRTPAIAVDDVDAGLDTSGSERVFEALRTVADAGQLVLAACTRSDPPADTVVDLRDHHRLGVRNPRHEHQSTEPRRRRELTRNGGHR